MALECFNLAFRESKDKVSYLNSKYLEHKTSSDPIIIPVHKDGQTGHWYGILIKENKFIVLDSYGSNYLDAKSLLDTVFTYFLISILLINGR